MVVAVSAPVLLEPLVASLPVQPPEALQEVAFVEDQVSVELPLLETLPGLALRETVGAVVTTAMLNGGSAAVCEPFDTLTTMFGSIGALPAAGVPASAPFDELNCAQAGLLDTAWVS